MQQTRPYKTSRVRQVVPPNQERAEAERLREVGARQAAERGRTLGELVRLQEWNSAYEATAKHEALAVRYPYY